MLNKRRSFGTRKVSPPQPICMTEDQKAIYLKSLRNDRPSRPTGSRPLPSRPSLSTLNHASETSRVDSAPLVEHNDRGSQIATSNRVSLLNSASVGSMKGRPLVMNPMGTADGRKVTPPEIRYKESNLRQKEKLEAQSLRHALEEMDFQVEEARIHQAAQLEAADLVWKHRNPGSAEKEKTAPYRNPDLARKRVSIRTNRPGFDHHEMQRTGRSVSDSSNESSQDVIKPLRYSKRSLVGEHMNQLPNAPLGSRRTSSGSRKISSGSSKGMFRNPDDQIYEESSQFEPQMSDDYNTDQALRIRSRNPSVRHFRPLPHKPFDRNLKPEVVRAGLDTNKHIPPHVNDGSSRSGSPESFQSLEDMSSRRESMLEVRSEDIRAATSMKRSDRSPNLPTPTAVSDKPGRPIVSFNPSWKPSDNASPLPVSNERPSSRSLPVKPLRANSSRDSLDSRKLAWRQSQEVSAQNSAQPHISTTPNSEDRIPHVGGHRNLPPPPPMVSVATPEIAITGPSEPPASRGVPSINIDTEEKLLRSSPSINMGMDSNQRPSPVLSTSKTSGRCTTNDALTKPRMPWLSRQSAIGPVNGMRPATVTCSACALPISGRIVTASGALDKLRARFHPECFTCFHCSTGLECVSFYPEPESSRLKRLGLNSDGDETYTSNESTTMSYDADLRFFCHLDYHDLFSPRCASCHTPIEGAVILAAGKSWHEGHFFCAECGDPFSSTSPFVESQGYAYCVGCHTRRTSARCKACKKQILDDVTVQALGGKWHEECFRCDECGSDFGDEGKFFIREIEIDLTEKEKRKGLQYKKIEERAVCDACEATRLKSRDVAAFL